jgi:hypothetical protein
LDAKINTLLTRKRQEKKRQRQLNKKKLEQTMNSSEPVVGQFALIFKKIRAIRVIGADIN